MLAAALHVAMFLGFSRASDLPAAIIPLLYLFNAAVLATVLFFAYVSFFRRGDLLRTGLGRATCLFIGLFYIQRGLVEVLVSGVNRVLWDCSASPRRSTCLPVYGAPRPWRRD